MPTKICYLYLLCENMSPPHCVTKFAPVYGDLHWPTAWRSLSFFDIDRQVIDLNWKISHGVPFTAQRLVRLGLSVPLSCFCGSPVESLEHLFLFRPLAQSVLCIWINTDVQGIYLPYFMILFMRYLYIAIFPLWGQTPAN